MNGDLTQPLKLDQRTVNYRCVCGADLQVDVEVGGQCPSCQKMIAPRVLKHDLTLSLTSATGQIDPGATTDSEVGDTRPMDELVGKSFGHFQLLTRLGQGGMGQVYRALDTSLQRYVAVKVLRQVPGGSSTGQTDNLVDKLLQEAVSQARVSHPNIVSIFYVGKQCGDPFLAMELVPGQTVAKKIESSSLSFAEITSLAIQIVEALRVSFELDIIHGDIKPSNILLQPNGVAKLSDFGMARRASMNSDRGFGGTPNYLAPELLDGRPPTIQSDMYALGVTLYEMTFERLPIKLSGSSVKAWAESHENRKIEFPSPWPEKLPEGWRTILNKLLNKNPADRYESYDLLIRDLYRVMPVRSQAARPLPRMFAALIDYMLVSTVFVLVALLAFFLQSMVLSWLNLGEMGAFSRLSKDLPWYLELTRIFVNLLFSLAMFVPILLYTIWVAFWRQSVGRALMHVRVYNEYGLRPSPRLMAIRDSLRMLAFWVVPIVFFVQITDFWRLASTAILAGATGLFWLVDATMCIFAKNGQSLHDYLLGTNVVLDTDAGF